MSDHTTDGASPAIRQTASAHLPETPTPDLPISPDLHQQTFIGNRQIANQPHLMRRVAMPTSNRAAVQRWPGASKPVDLHALQNEVNNLDFDATLSYQLFVGNRTLANGNDALTKITTAQEKMRGVQNRLTAAKPATDDQADLREMLLRENGRNIEQAAKMIERVKTGIADLRFQAVMDSDPVSDYVNGMPAGPSAQPAAGPSTLDKVEAGGKTTLQTGWAMHKVNKGVKAAALLSSQDKDGMISNANADLTAPPVSDGGARGILSSIKGFLDSIKARLLDVTWIKSVLDFLQPVAKYAFLGGALATGYSLYSTWGRYEALRDAKESEEQNAPTSQLAQSLIYGFAKVRRALYWNISKFGMALSKVLARLITLLTGGASALVTESIALAADLASSTMYVGRKLKALYKMLRGTKGKGRERNAATIYDSALRGDKTALKLFIAIKPFGMMSNLKDKTSISTIPTDEAGMLGYLHSVEHRHGEIQQELADALKSS